VISIVVLTHSRVHLLRQCVENVLGRTSDATEEILIWDNASTDGTGEYLETIADPRVTFVRHATNIGQNAYALAFARTGGEFMIELDDDVIDAPRHWDRMLLDAYRQLPEVGFLAADLVDNEYDEAAMVRYRIRPHLYVPEEVNGVRLLTGPTGGGCAITSRALNERVGGFRQHMRKVFWEEETAYIDDIAKLGYRAAILRDLQVLHAGGPRYSTPSPEKTRYWVSHRKKQARKNVVKRALLRIPFVAPLNTRLRVFEPPARIGQL
jgi:GT2 family glycosyltransferase